MLIFTKRSLKMSWFLAGIVILASIFRIALLDKIPTGISNDELDYILNAKSVYLQGSDISNTWNPFSLTTPSSSFPQAEIAPLVMALFVGILPLSLFLSKLSYALVSVATVVLIYLIAKKLFDQKVALISGLVACINPWLIFFGRTAYDTPLAIFFFLCALYVLLITKRWHLLFAFPFFLLGFYAYIGTKLILIPFVALTSYYSWRFVNNKKYSKQYLILAAFCVALFFVYAGQAILFSNNRVSEISSPFMSSITSDVDYQRKQSVDTPLNEVFSNKFTVFADYSIEKYFNTFSPNFLFLSGDSKPQFTLWEHGVFYVVDAIFIILGFYHLLKRHRKEGLLICSLVLIAPLPSVVSNVGNSYAIRSMLMAPLLLIIIGIGIKNSFDVFKPRLKLVLGFVVVLIYIVQLANFLNIYLLRNPIYNSESFNFSARELVRYLFLPHQNKNIYVVNGDPKTPIKHYLFYRNMLDTEVLNGIEEMYKTKKYKIGNINFINCQQIPANLEGDILIYELGSKCKNLDFSKHIAIGQLKDSGAIYNIVNDNVCSNFELRRFVGNVKFNDLDIEKLSDKDFCEKFVIEN